MNENKIKNFLVNGFTIKEGSGEIPVDIADTEEEPRIRGRSTWRLPNRLPRTRT